jgi:short-subunit dehydrogenase
VNYFHNKTILITGGSAGIGFALAKRIAAFSPNYLLLLAHQQKKLDDAVDTLRRDYPQVSIKGIQADIGDAAVPSIVEDILQQYGAPNILINNAGYAHYHLFSEMSQREVYRHIQVNLTGAMLITHAFLPAMRKKKQGQIINVASIAGHMMITPNLVYSAAKHGLTAWSEGLSVELAKDNITVQVISPGRVLTDFFEHESFQKRTAGAERRFTVSLDKVIDVFIKAIVKQKKRVIVPAYWMFAAWLIHACPVIFKRLYFVYLKKRLANMHPDEGQNTASMLVCKQVACPITQQKATVYCRKQGGTYYINKKNGVIFLHPMPDLDRMKNYANVQYKQGVYRDYVTAKPLKLLTAYKRLDMIDQYSPGKRMLDIGCAAGFFWKLRKVEGIMYQE